MKISSNFNNITKTLIVSVSLLMAHKTIQAQEFGFEWESLLSVPDGGSVWINYSVVYKDQLFFTGSYTGEEISFGDIAYANSGNRDYIMGCLSLNGEPKWLKTAIGSGNERGFKILVNDLEELVVFGFYSGQNIVFNEDHHLGNFDPSRSRTALYGGEFSFTATYSPDGEMLQASSKSLSTIEHPVSVTDSRDAEGNTYHLKGIGPKNPALLENGNTYKTSGGSDVLLIKKNARGSIEWVRKIGGTFDDTAILRVGSDQLTLAMTYKSRTIQVSDGIQLNNKNPGYEGVGIIRYSSKGDPLWATDIHFKGKSSVVDLLTDENGATYVVGNTGIIPDGFVAKIAPSGVLEWKQMIGGIGYDYTSSFQLNDSSLYVLGAFKSSQWFYGFIPPPGLTSPRPHADKDMFLLSMNRRDGTVNKFIQMGGKWPGSGNSVGTSDGMIILRNGKPGIYFDKISFSQIEQLSTGYSFTELRFQEYHRTGSLIVPPDYSYITTSSEVQNKDHVFDKKHKSSDQSSSNEGPMILEEAERKVNQAGKKLKSWGNKLERKIKRKN